MVEGKLARRYGKALFELVTGHEDEVATELASYRDAYTDSDLNKVLDNPAFDVKDRTAVALEVAEKLGLSQATRNMIALLVTRGRVSYLESIVAHYHRLLDELRNRVHATVIVPRALAEARRGALRDLVSKLSGKEAVLKEQIDPSILGGVIIEVSGKVYDGSVRTQLQDLKQDIERTF